MSVEQTYTTGSGEQKGPTPVKGYRQLTEEEIHLMNLCKDQGEALSSLIVRLEQDSNTDKRWLAIAKTDLQKGIMFLVRSIARPSTF